ncbi:MAG: FAD-dependent oxidoreductase [Chitinophagaceae bacterium]|nr:FAD-dependent oxidoreductase [Chitinophagaceae bacterium]
MNVRSNEPFWLVQNGLLHNYPSLHQDIHCDVLIVGSGITGSLMAHACIKEGYQTALIDKREIANGSTSATTSMLQYELDTPLHKLIDQIGEAAAVASYKSCREAIYKIQEVVNEVKSCCGFELKKSLYFCAQSKDLKDLKKEYETRKQYGFDVQWLEEDQLKAQYGIVSQGAILSADGASIDAFKLAHDILYYNVQKGLQVFDKTESIKITYQKDKIFLKTQTGHAITTSKIIYCTGYETQHFLPEKIVKLKSTYACISEVQHTLSPALKDTLFWNTGKPYLYLRATDEGRILIGGEDEDFKNANKRDLLLDRKEYKLKKTFQEVMPHTVYHADFMWAGTFGETKDSLPYIGEHTKFPNSYFVLGFGGNGITFSAIGMTLIIDLINKQTNPLSHFFRFGR